MVKKIMTTSSRIAWVHTYIHFDKIDSRNSLTVFVRKIFGILTQNLILLKCEFCRSL